MLIFQLAYNITSASYMYNSNSSCLFRLFQSMSVKSINMFEKVRPEPHIYLIIQYHFITSLFQFDLTTTISNLSSIKPLLRSTDVRRSADASRKVIDFSKPPRWNVPELDIEIANSISHHRQQKSRSTNLNQSRY